MEFDFLIQIVLAGLCGMLIGYERKSRMKEAGIRTHFVVAIGASLMMIVSKYGFQDLLGQDGIALDPSRIAAQVVSGVGFLGAGMIFLQRQTVKGLTTAAGIWATAGIGMAIGSRMYIVGIGVTLLILIAQKLLHSSRVSWLGVPRTEQLCIRIQNEPEGIEQLRGLFEEKGISLLNFHTEKLSGTSEIMMEITARLPAAFDAGQLLPLIQQLPFVNMVEIQ
ncbi:MgtC/SapB family protein [Paenibacillus tuaregi]|uniref:MgtC/SapB family protein n=1 Tax=Paenibacillus tuaregi TaxID=1816681 RepID=UPI0008387368|nr:MgtC/SapB family protein [Paenibacillus tuaregi]